MAVIRKWSGVAKPDLEAGYLAHFENEVLPNLRKINGFVDATVLRRVIEAGIEITVLTRWISMDAVKEFAGDTVDVAVVTSAARPCFVGYDEFVTHHEIVIQMA
jgi:heme-degrading monooxygenase HmoA